MHQLELRDGAHDYRMDAAVIVHPGHEGAHEIRHFAGRRRRVERRA